jgi:hypothetical protein
MMSHQRTRKGIPASPLAETCIRRNHWHVTVG